MYILAGAFRNRKRQIQRRKLLSTKARGLTKRELQVRQLFG